MRFSTCLGAKHFLWFLTLKIFVCLICASGNTTSWTKLQISPDTLCSMPYGNFRVKIYEHSNNHKSTTDDNKKRYFYAPVAMLDHNSAISRYNNATKQAEMRFQIAMWSDNVQQEVVKYVGDFLDKKIRPNQVEIISFEQVLLKTTKPSTVYSLSTEWHSYSLEKSLWFTLTCFQKVDCDELKDIMRESPSEFHHFKLLFSMSSQTAQTKETVIRIENIVAGQMMSNLLQKFPPGTDPLLTAKEANQLLSEMATNVMVETFDDSDIVSPDSESQIYNIMKDLLVSSRTTISKQDDKMWNSVFWNDDNYRPDMSSKKLNEIYNQQDKDTQKKMEDVFKMNGLISIEAGGEGKLAIGGHKIGETRLNVHATIDTSRETFTSHEEINKLYHESKDHVEWNGESFVPKPLSLSKINLGNVRDAQKFQDRSVRVRYSTAVLSTPIHFTPFTNIPKIDEWVKLRSNVSTLKQELDDMKSKLETSNNGSQKAISELKLYFVSTLNKELDDMKSKLETSNSGSQKAISELQLNLRNVTENIHFSAFWHGKFGPGYLWYDRLDLNEGSGMDRSTGRFTAPKAGTYLFTFHAEINPILESRLTIRFNDYEAKTRISNDKYHGVDRWFWSSAMPRWQTATMSTILQLIKGDRVAIYLNEGNIAGSAYFCGILIR